MKRSCGDVCEVPCWVVTVTSTLAGGSPGSIASIWVADITLNEVALRAPKSTLVVPIKLVPDIVT